MEYTKKCVLEILRVSFYSLRTVDHVGHLIIYKCQHILNDTTSNIARISSLFFRRNYACIFIQLCVTLCTGNTFITRLK